MGKSFTLHLDGTAYTIEQQGRAIVVNGKRYEPRISGATVDFGETKLNVELSSGQAIVDGVGHLFATEGLEQRSFADLRAAAGAVAGNGLLTAIMPGLIIRVPVQQGDAVKAGDVIVVLEAMKMENEICAPIDGTVKELWVKRGDIVEQNKKLALIE